MSENHVKERAREQTRMVLAQSNAFLSMPFSEQRKLYSEVYDANVRRLERKSQPYTSALARRPPDDPTDPRKFRNERIDQAGQLAGEFIESVNFPQFVKDLTLAVFRGNLEVQHAQTEDFIRLLKAATASLSNYVKEVDDFSAMARLADSEPDRFQIALPPMPDDDDEEEQKDAAPTPTLLDSQGNPVDLGDNQIKAKILDTKVAMAQENRALLREILLLGVSRMIIRKGKIEAACVFDIKAKESMNRVGQRSNETVDSSGGNVGGGLNLGFLSFGGGHSGTHRETEISVSSATGKTSTDLSAKITGSVSLEIESDFFKLDNFADMYKQIAAPAPGAAATTPPALPAPAAA
jgi:hypothetical protein